MRPPLIDLHEDISLYYTLGGAHQWFAYDDFSKNVRGRHGDIPKFRKANVKLVFSSIAPLVSTISERRVDQLRRGYGVRIKASRLRSPTLMALEHFLVYIQLSKKHRGDIRLVTSQSDLKGVGDRATMFLVAIEGAEAFEDVEDLEIFYRLGLRSVQLTWNFDNKYAASCMSEKDYGLTGDGEDLVQLCNEKGVILDLAHASKKALLETLSLSKLPVIVSHANASGVRKHVRNLDDEELEALKKRNGVIGFDLISPTISRVANVESLAEHVAYVYKNFGNEILAIGTDYFGLGDVKEPQGLEDITKFGNLWNELLERGLTENDIEKMAWKNAMRVIEANARRWHTI